MKYRERASSLAALCFRSYGEYLHSFIWRTIREALLKKYPLCCRCAAPTTQVHHLRYDIATMAGVSDINLLPLCRQCHQDAEFDEGGKNGLPEANCKLGVNRRPPKVLTKKPWHWDSRRWRSYKSRLR